MIELEDDNEPSKSIDLAAPWEFATWQRTEDPGALPEPAAAPEAAEEQLQLADPWEFIKWRDPKEAAAAGQAPASDSKPDDAEPKDAPPVPAKDDK